MSPHWRSEALDFSDQAKPRPQGLQYTVRTLPRHCEVTASSCICVGVTGGGRRDHVRVLWDEEDASTACVQELWKL